MSSRKVLILFAHPAFERSRVNSGLAESVRARELIRNVEKMILAEVERGRRHEIDRAWDTTGLIDEYGNQEDPEGPGSTDRPNSRSS